MKNKIACVTGASGMVGRRIVEQLIQEGYKVRVLNRQKWFILKDVDVFIGGLEDEAILKQFVSGADYMYHCAAELKDEIRMRAVNIEGTQKLIETTQNSTIKHFLYLSSAGVVGVTKEKNVHEDTPCNPLTTYERTKWEAENFVNRGIDGCSVVILRPTNIVDYDRLGVLSVASKSSLLNSLALYVRGDECAHIVHAKDVARAALYFSRYKFDKPKCYFISRDYDPLNTYSGIKKICTTIKNNGNSKFAKNKDYPPIFIPYLLRKLRIKNANWGDVRYSSEKIESAGFKYAFDTEKTIKDIISYEFGYMTRTSTGKEAINKDNKLETLVIIGATGFIGNNLVSKLSTRNDLKLHILVKKDENIKQFKNFSNTKIFKGTLFHTEILKCLITPGCTVLNLAYMENESQKNNLRVIENLSAVCKKRKIKRLVHCSTATVVGKIRNRNISEETKCVPKTNYDITKFKIEEFLANAAQDNFELAILRPTSVFGPGGKNLIKLANHLTMGNALLNYIRTCVSGKRWMNLVCIDNVLRAIMFICESQMKFKNDIFIISDDNNPNNNYRDIENFLMDRFNIKKYPIPRIPLPSIFLSIVLRVAQRSITQTKRNYSSRKLLQLGYLRTTTLEEELYRFSDWYAK